MDNEKIIKGFVIQIQDKIKAQGITIEEAREKISEYLPSEDLQELLNEASLILMRQKDNIKKGTGVLSANKEKEFWYYTKEEDIIWQTYKNFLLKDKKWESENVEQLDMETSSVMNEIINPRLRENKRIQGLVLGYVQSGKTSNMAGVIAKAADSGYKFVIVFAGLTDALRKQTQIRIQNDITNRTKERWYWLTDENNDYIPTPQSLPRLETNVTKICVVKKNVMILERLLGKINELSDSRILDMKTLIIDDECDQASLNTKENKDIAGDISGTNKRIKQMLQKLKIRSYIGYTATPNAPFLTNPQSADGTQSLFPSDFIIPLKEPQNYFGVNKLFYSESESDEEIDLPYIKRIKDIEIPKLRPSSQKDRFNFIPELTNSLSCACDYYLLSLAARASRGLSEKHCCMMIHTSRYTEVHDSYLPLIKGKWLKILLADLRENKLSTFERLEKLWEKETKRLSLDQRSKLNCPNNHETFSEIKKYLLDEAESIKVLRENSNNENEEDRLDFEKKRVHAIVIGGDVLSRGLTVEGLVCSFFLRESKNDDTLMQMGRWFGYRKGYEDLPRIWMPYDVEYDFGKFVEKDEYMRRRIISMREQGLTPREFPPEVAISKGRNPAAKNKIAKNVMSSNNSFYDEEKYTLRFPLDQEFHKKNKSYIETLIDRLSEESGKHFEKINDCNVIKNVSYKPILDFIYNFQFAEEETFSGAAEFIKNEIEKEDEDSLKNWNFGIMQGKGEGKIDLSFLKGIKPCIRNKIEENEELKNKQIYIKALTGSTDLLIDVNREDFWKWKDQENQSGISERELARQYRRKIYGNRPLLIIYPISKNSKPNPNKKSDRLALFDNLDIEYEKHDIFGLLIAFPRSPRRTFTVQKALKIC